MGEITLRLPEGNYEAAIDTGVGEANIIVSEGAILDLSIDGGVGKVILTLPRNLPVRIEAAQGIGGIRVPASLTRMDGDPSDGDFGIGGGGVWQSSDYAETSDDARLSIRYDGGIGELEIIRR